MAFTRSRGLFESTRVLFLPIHDIAPNPGQPRTRFSHESLEELADSIRAHGILQPLSVRRLSTSQYELISGERRLRAAEMAGLSHVPCILVKAGDLESSLLALVENLQRRDLDFVEEAPALQKLIFIPACKIIAFLYHLSRQYGSRSVCVFSYLTAFYASSAGFKRNSKGHRLPNSIKCKITIFRIDI